MEIKQHFLCDSDNAQILINENNYHKRRVDKIIYIKKHKNARHRQSKCNVPNFE